jgi:hypothetical protein
LTGPKLWQVKIQKGICDAVDTIVGLQEAERPPKRIKVSRQYDLLDDEKLRTRDKAQLEAIVKSVGDPKVQERPLQCNLLVIEPLSQSRENHMWAFRFVNRKTIASHANRRQERANLLPHGQKTRAYG